MTELRTQLREYLESIDPVSATEARSRHGLPRRRGVRWQFAAAAAAVLLLFGVPALLMTGTQGGDFFSGEPGNPFSTEFDGSVRYSPFVSVQQDLVSASNIPLFVVEGPATGVQRMGPWSVLALDSFDGMGWIREETSPTPVGEEGRLVDYSPFAGPAASFEYTFTILGLQVDWLPVPPLPVAVMVESEAVDGSLRHTEDGSIAFGALTYRGLRYSVTAAMPDDGPETVWSEPQDFDRLASLPDDTRRLVEDLAFGIVAGSDSDLDRALALESYFRSGSGHPYSLDVPAGSDVVAWLLTDDPGYSEQFASGAAVLARAVGLPSRVVIGFRTGAVLDDGRLVVRERDVHAWAEVWIRDRGWTRLDPTPAPLTESVSSFR